MHMPRLVPAVVAAALSLVPFGRAYAQDVDQQAVLLGKLCDVLRDPVSLGWVRGLGGQAQAEMVETVANRFLFFKFLREKQLALEAVAQLNVMELGLPNESQKAKDALAQIRRGLQAQAEQAENNAGRAAVKSADAFQRLCGDVQPPSNVTLQPLPGLLPLIGVVTVPPAPPVRLSACGTWRWNSGPGWTTAVLSRNGRASNAAGGPCNGRATGTWSESGSTVTVIWTWLCPGGNSKSRDELALSKDGNTLTMPGDSGWRPATRTGACQ